MTAKSLKTTIAALALGLSTLFGAGVASADENGYHYNLYDNNGSPRSKTVSPQERQVQQQTLQTQQQINSDLHKINTAPMTPQRPTTP